MQVEINGKKFSVKPHQSVQTNAKNEPYFDNSDVAIIRNEKNCIGCGLCKETCLQYNNLAIPLAVNINDSCYFRPDGKKKVSESRCTRCGQCVIVCPTGTLREQENIDDVKKAIADPHKIVIAQIAPSLRVSLSEAFGKEPGQILDKQMVAVLKKLGFDYVFDVNLGADFTTYEEAHDLKKRIEKNTNLPLFTSCCPARVKFIEDFHPHLIPNITTVRSPQQCLATITKTYFAQKQNIDPRNIVVVSIMPCVAKKFESRRIGENKSGLWDVDWVLTTREIIKMFKEAKLDPTTVNPQNFDRPLGLSSGAGAIYGASGGVMESAIRTFAEIFSGQQLEKIDYQEFRGTQGIKKADLKIGNKTIKIAIATGLANAEKIFTEIKNGAIYHYVEVMACPGGCVGGGGQPKPANLDIINKRRMALYEIDKHKSYRKAQDNPVLKTIYKEFLGKPGGEKAKKYLHTNYII